MSTLLQNSISCMRTSKQANTHTDMWTPSTLMTRGCLCYDATLDLEPAVWLLTLMENVPATKLTNVSTSIAEWLGGLYGDAIWDEVIYLNEK